MTEVNQLKYYIFIANEPIDFIDRRTTASPSTLFDGEFLSNIQLLSSAFANQEQTEAMQANFIRLADLPRKRLPQNSTTRTAEQFVVVTITMISDKASINAHFSAKAIKVLHTFLRFDQQVFQMFRPNKPLLMKMRMEEHIMSVNPVEAENALELTYFLLRYHRAVDFSDFSDLLHVTQRIRRYHDYKVWFEFESLSGQQEDLTGNFSEFKDMTQKAINEIMQHLMKVSEDSGGLKQRIDKDMTAINAQIESYKSQAAKASETDEKYKSLLDLVMHLENKLNQTSKQLVNDLRKDFTIMLDRNKTETVTPSDLQDLKRDLEQFVLDKHVRNEVSYRRLYESIDALESKHDTKFTAQINLLKSKLEEKIRGQHSQLEGTDLQNLQKMQELLRQLESKIDSRTVELVKDLQAEIVNLKQSTNQNLDSSLHNLKTQLKTLGDRLDQSNSQNAETYAQLELKLQHLITNRQTKTEQQSQQQQESILETIASLERKIERRIEQKLIEAGTVQNSLHEESKIFVTDKVKKTYERFQHDMDELELGIKGKQEEIQIEFRKEFDKILEESVKKAEGLTIQNYVKLLGMLQDTEKRIDLKQKDMIEDLQTDFHKILASLDNSQVIKEIEVTFARKFQDMKNDFERGDRATQSSFDSALQQLNQEQQTYVNVAIKSANEIKEKEMDEKVDDQVAKNTAKMFGLIKNQKDFLMLQIAQMQDLTDRNVQDKVKMGLDDAKVKFSMDIDYVRNELNSKIAQTIDRRLLDSQDSININLDAKLSAAFARENEQVIRRTNESLQGLRAHADATSASKIETVEKQLNSTMALKLQDFASNVTQASSQQQQATDLEIKQSMEQLRKDLVSKITEATSEINLQKDQEFKAQNKKFISYLDRLKQRFDQININYDQLSLGINGQISELKSSSHAQLEARMSEIRQTIDKLLFDSQTNLDKQFRAILVERLDESQNSFRPEIEAKIRAAMNRTVILNQKELDQKLQEAFLANNDRILKKASSMDQHSIRVTQSLTVQLEEFVKSNAIQIADLSNKIIQSQTIVMASMDQVINQDEGKRGGNTISPDIVNKLSITSGLIDKIKLEQKAQNDMNMKKFNTLEGKFQGFNSEIDNLLKLRVSNQVTTISKSMNDKLQSINDQYSGQTNLAQGGITSRIDQLEQFRTQTGHISEKQSKMETTLTDQVDMINTLNDRMSLNAQQTNQFGQRVETTIGKLEKKFVSIIEQLTEKEGDSEAIKEMREICGTLQRNDDQMQSDIYILKEQVEEDGKIEKEMKKIRGNHDDLIKKFLQNDREIEQRFADSNKRISNFNDQYAQGQISQNSVIQKLNQNLQRLENDVHVQIDNSLKELDKKQIEFQRDVSNMQESLDNLVMGNEKFQVQIKENINQQLIRVNSNLDAQEREMNEREQRIQEAIQLMNSEVQKGNSKIGSIDQNKKDIQDMQVQLDGCAEALEQTTNMVGMFDETFNNFKIQIGPALESVEKIEDISRQVNNNQNIWNFHQKYINEQARDKVNILQAKNDFLLEAKLHALEWLIRYMDYISYGAINNGIVSFKTEYQTNQMTQAKQNLTTLTGHSDITIKTMMIKLRQLYQTFMQPDSQNDKGYQLYQDRQSQVLKILDPLLMNEQNVRQFIEMDGISGQIVRVLHEQELSGNQPQTRQGAKNVPGAAFKEALKCLKQIAIREDAAMAFLSERQNMLTLITVTEQFADEEIVLTTVGVLMMMIQSKVVYKRLIEVQPGVGNFLAMVSKLYIDNADTTLEILKVLRYFLALGPNQATQIGGEWFQELAMLKIDPNYDSIHDIIDSIIKYGKQN